jgi:hypothetical protein
MLTDNDFLTATNKVGVTLTADEMAALSSAFARGPLSKIKSYLGYDPTFKDDRIGYYPRAERVVGDEYLILSNLPVRSVAVNVDTAARFGQPAGSHSGADLVQGEDYFVEYDFGDSCDVSMSGHLIRASGNWDFGQTGVVRVTYSSGFTQDELDGIATNGVDASAIKASAMLAVSKLLRMATSAFGSQTATGNTGAIVSEKAGDYAVTFDSASIATVSSQTFSLTPEMMELLHPFVSYNQVGE